MPDKVAPNRAAGSRVEQVIADRPTGDQATGDQAIGDQPIGELATVDRDWAWQPYSPTAAAPWNLQRAAHLYRRAGFGADWHELQQAISRSPAECMQSLFESGSDAKAFYAEANSTVAALWASSNRQDLPAWWLYVMLHTPRPLLEKMTLFWHGHFATSMAKVNDGRLMYQQNETLRRGALGSFRPLLLDMARDPAMLIWLDSATNRKSQPNENFAREVMELFALGVGHYSEADIKQAARSFTGWEVRQNAFRVNQHHHDTGEKTVLGKRGPWNGDDVIRILLEQPAAAEFLVGKIFRYLVSEDDPPASLIAPLAAGYRRHDYDTGWLVRTMLSSNLFYSPLAMGHKIKSPVEYAVGLVRALEGKADSYVLAEDLNKLGQGLFFPPNVKGWDGGREWINASTLVGRANLAWALVSGRDGRYGGKIHASKIAALNGADTPAATARRLVDLLVSGPLPGETLVRLTALASDGPRDEALPRLVHAIATLPEFQLA
jgi:uncharacterized protein (DUF1800 family)